MKKVISMLLVFALVLGMMPPTAYAAESDVPTVTVTTDKTVLKAGDSITISLSIDKPVTNLMNYEYIVYFNKEAYTRAGSTVGEAYEDTVVGYPLKIRDKWGCEFRD